MAVQIVGPDGWVIEEEGTDQYALPSGWIFNENQAEGPTGSIVPVLTGANPEIILP